MNKRKAFLSSGMLLVLALGAQASSSAYAMDAEMLRSEKKTVVGTVEVKFDPGVNQKAATLLEKGSGKTIQIDLLAHLPADFQKAVLEAAQTRGPFEISGTIETWSDGNVVLNLRKPYQYRILPK